MGNNLDVEVRLDNRLRLMSAVLAATDWPEKVQQTDPHGTHAHARATLKMISAYRTHPAVQAAQRLLDQHAPLEALFTLALCLDPNTLAFTLDTLPAWVPAGWVDQLGDFQQEAGLMAWWVEEDSAWGQSVQESQRMFDNVCFKPFLAPFLGEVSETLMFMPNILYPSDQEVGIRLGNELTCLAAPRLAWGDSPPWPFDEDPAHIYRVALQQYTRLLLEPYLHRHAERVAAAAQTSLPVDETFALRHTTWEDQFVALFVTAVVAIYLEDHVSEAEAKAYVLMARKIQGLTILPGTISVLRRYLAERESGRYTELADFLGVFARQLRVTKRIMAL